MQDDVIVAGIAMVPMHNPVAGTYVKFDIADVSLRVRHVSYVLLQQRRARMGVTEHSIAHIGSRRATGASGEEKLVGVSIAQG